jgi:hypothetical protein
MTVLAPALEAETAVIAALALRLTWVLGELLAAAILALVRPPLHLAAPVPEGSIP